MSCSLTPRAEKIVRNALSAVRDGGMMVSTHRFDQPGFNHLDSGFKVNDIRPDNLGYIDGNLVVIDYGFRITTPDGRIGPEGSEYFGQSPHEKRMEEHFG